MNSTIRKEAKCKVKYARINVICSHQLVEEIDEFLNSNQDQSFILRDFLTETKEGVIEELSKAGRERNEYPQIKITLPAAMRTLVVPYEKRSHSDLQLLFDEIASQRDIAFKR